MPDATKEKEVAETEKFDAKWLKGLRYSTTEVQGKGKDAKRVPVSRPLKEDDVLGWKVRGNEVVIVAADGKKYRVEK